MTVVRRLARPMLASIFIVGGLDALRNPKSKVGAAEDVGPAIASGRPSEGVIKNGCFLPFTFPYHSK